MKPAKNRMRDALLYILTILMIVLFLEGQAQPSGEFAYTRFTCNEGLAGNTVYALLEDRRGYLWAATETGVSRYDGYKFENFTVSNGLPVNEVLTMFEDSKGRIWFSSLSKRPFYYDPVREKIITEKTDLLLKNIPEGCEAVYEKKDGTVLFAGIYKHAVGGYPKCPKEWSDFLAYHKKNSLHYIFIISSMEEKNDELLVNMVAERYSLKNGTITQKSIIYFYHESHYIRTYTPKGCAYIGAVFRVDTFDISLSSNSNYREVKAARKQFEKKIIHSCIKDPDDEKVFWLATNSGIGKIDLNKPPTDEYESIGNEFVNRILIDRNRNKWLGTRGRGLILITPSSESLLHYPETKGNFIASLSNCQKGSILAGSDVGIYYDLKAQKLNRKSTPMRGRILGFNTVEKETWCYGDKGILKIRDESGAENAYFFYSQSGIKKEIYDSLSNIFIGGMTGIRIQRPIKDTVYSFLNESRVYGLTLGSEYLYAGTNSGLFRLKRVLINPSILRSNHKPTRFSTTRKHYFNYIKLEVYTFFFDVPPDSLPELRRKHPVLNEEIRCLLTDKRGGLWVATLDHGLCYINGNQYRNWDERNGLKSASIPSVNSLYEDSLGNIWVATMKGIHRVRFNTRNEPILEYMFGYPEGLLSDETLCTLRSGDKLYVGTGEGLNVIDLKKWNPVCREVPQMHFTGLRVNDGACPVNRTEYSFPYDSARFQFDFTGISLGKKVKYEFILTDSDGDTIDKGFTENTFYRISGLRPGDYTLKIRGMTAPDCISAYKEFHWEVRSYWLYSRWGIAGQILLVCGLLGGGLFVFLRRTEKKNKARMKDLQKRIGELTLEARLAQIKPHFVSNALTAIRNKMLREEWDLAHKYIVLFSELARNILDRSARLEISLSEEIDNLTMYLKLQQLRFEDENHEPTFYYEVVYDPALDSEKDRILIPTMIIQPFVENSVEHGFRYEEFVQKNRKGHIRIEFRAEENSVICTVTDNGIGRAAAVEKKKELDYQKVLNGQIPRISRGMKITEERILSINELFFKSESIKLQYSIEDLQESDGSPAGTKVTLVIPGSTSSIRLR